MHVHNLQDVCVSQFVEQLRFSDVTNKKSVYAVLNSLFVNDLIWLLKKFERFLFKINLYRYLKLV